MNETIVIATLNSTAEISNRNIQDYESSEWNWSENQIGGIAVVSSDDDTDNTIVKLAYAMNPRENQYYPPINPFRNTTDFKEDKSSRREECLKSSIYQGWYFLAEDSIHRFNETYPGNYLMGNEQRAARVAFALSELGYSFLVLVHTSETGLIKFCQEQGWTYIAVEDWR